MHLYMDFWRNNGNVAALWHAGAVVMVIGCVVMIFWGDKNDRALDRERNRRSANEVFENFERYPENTDHHDY